jgi:hypothetical protein
MRPSSPFILLLSSGRGSAGEGREQGHEVARAAMHCTELFCVLQCIEIERKRGELGERAKWGEGKRVAGKERFFCLLALPVPPS